MISPICDTFRVRTTYTGMKFRRVAVSAAASVRLRIRNQLARPGPGRSSDTALEGKATFWALARVVVRRSRTAVVECLNRGIVGAG